MAGSKNQNRSTLRSRLRSALAHRSSATTILSDIIATQNALNSALSKLDADSVGALDTDYVATCSIPAANKLSPDAVTSAAADKATLRRIMERGIGHRAAADEYMDALVELQTAHAALLAKLDAEAGTLAGTNYAATLSVHPALSASAYKPAQSNASLRSIMRAGMANESLADQMLDNLIAAQNSFNSALAKIDAHTINGQCAQFVVTVLDMESRS